MDIYQFILHFPSRFCQIEYEKKLTSMIPRDKNESESNDFKTDRRKINVCDIEKLLGPTKKVDSELSRRGSDLFSLMQNFAKEMKGREMAEDTIIRGKHMF
jgi:hypothetical protein